MKFIKPFAGVKAGDIYPTEFAIGDECPAELEAAAIEVGAADDDAKAKAKTKRKG